MSNDYVECKWFEKTELKRNKIKKTDLQFVKSTEFYNPREGEPVELASGGPRMVVDRCGPKDFSVAVAFGGNIARTNGSTRHDLVGCRWVSGKKEVRGEFEIGTVKPI